MPDILQLCDCVLTRKAHRSFRVFRRSGQEASVIPHKTIKTIRSSRSTFTQETGLTLVEMAVTIALLSILMAMSIGALSYYLAGRSLDTAVTELTTEIREAHSLAVASGNTYRLNFNYPDLSTYTLQRRSDIDWVNVRDGTSLPGGVSFSTSLQIGDDKYMEFYARGTSESGQLVLAGRYGGPRIITVDGETVNVK